VILLIRVVNLIIGWLSTANGDVGDLGVYQSDEFHPVVILFCKCNQIIKGHFSHFHRGTLGIKFFYRDAGRGYGDGGRICLGFTMLRVVWAY